MPPTALSILMSLSLRMISKSLGDDETLFKPSNANPPDIAPSPITATTCRSGSLFLCAATAMPNATEIELEACPHVNVSYSLSLGEGKGRMPPNLRLV